MGGCLSDVMEVDTSARVCIFMDVKKPLRRVQRVSVKQGVSALIEYKYERLPTFCYGCGLIGHIERDCPMRQVEDDMVEELGFRLHQEKGGLGWRRRLEVS